MFKALALIVLVICHNALASDPAINPYTTATEKARYSSYLACSYSTSFYNYDPYAAIRATYTPRDNFDCCYYADSRNNCCAKTVNGVLVCHCDPVKVTCGIPTTTTSTTTVPTTTTEPTTTTMPTTTTEPTTTTMPTTTTVPTTTTEMLTTTPPFMSLCAATVARVLNGVPADQCDFPGIANITTQNGQVSSCNAVYTTVTVNGEVKEAFLTADVCRQMIEAIIANDPRLSIGKQNYTIGPLFNRIQGPDGSAFLDAKPEYANLLSDLGACQQPACGYNEATMAGLVDFSDCKIVSYGASDAASLTQNGLNEVAIMETPAGCGTILEMFNAANTMCFTTISGQNLYCSGDSGSPVYCNSPTNGEWILVGVAGFQSGCDKGPEVRVISFPG